VVVDITIDPLENTFRTKLLKPRVKLDPALAIIGILGIPERKDRKIDSCKARHGIPHDIFMEIGGVVGWFSIAVG